MFPIVYLLDYAVTFSFVGSGRLQGPRRANPLTGA